MTATGMTDATCSLTNTVTGFIFIFSKFRRRRRLIVNNEEERVAKGGEGSRLSKTGMFFFRVFSHFFSPISVCVHVCVRVSLVLFKDVPLVQ